MILDTSVVSIPLPSQSPVSDSGFSGSHCSLSSSLHALPGLVFCCAMPCLLLPGPSGSLDTGLTPLPTLSPEPIKMLVSL